MKVNIPTIPFFFFLCGLMGKFRAAFLQDKHRAGQGCGTAIAERGSLAVCPRGCCFVDDFMSLLFSCLYLNNMLFNRELLRRARRRPPSCCRAWGASAVRRGQGLGKGDWGGVPPLSLNPEPGTDLGGLLGDLQELPGRGAGPPAWCGPAGAGLGAEGPRGPCQPRSCRGSVASCSVTIWDIARGSAV